MAQQLTKAEVDTIGGENARTFQRNNPDFYGCPANSQKVMDWLGSQLGTPDEYGFPYLPEHYQAAFEWLKENSILQQRPESREQIAARERDVQRQRESDNQLLAQAQRLQQTVDRAEGVLRNLPLNELRVRAAQQREALKGQHRSDVVPGSESRRTGAANVSDRAAARLRVAVNNPLISRESAAFRDLVEAELSKS